MADKIGGGRRRAAPKKDPASSRGEQVRQARAAGVGHNAAAVRDALELERARFTVERFKHQEVDNEIAAAKEVLKGLQARRKLIRTAIGNMGHLMEDFDEGMRLSQTSRLDIARKLKNRDRTYSFIGLDLGETPDLLDGVPPIDKVAADWHSVGYQMGLAPARGEWRQPPEGCPPERIQDFLRGWDEGQEVLSRSLEMVKADDARKAAERDPDQSDRGDGFEATPEELAAQAGRPGGETDEDDEEADEQPPLLH